MKAQHEQNVLFDRMRNGYMRALHDPEMPDVQRQRVINAMVTSAQALKQLPPQGQTTVEEEDG